jgi:CelD/BcsL family acetyltransferase involved in cellulose biosynthesis
MTVVHFTTLEQLAPFAADWDRLAGGVPFCSWAWMSTWWRHYGQGKRLFVLGVFDACDRLIGVAPWYVDRSVLWGRVVRFLGSGEICSEYRRLLVEPASERDVADAIADWLTQEKAEGGERKAERKSRDGSVRFPPSAFRSSPWDRLELTGVDAEDSSIWQLTEALRMRGSLVHQRPGPPCWRIELPATWDAYLAMLARGRRKQLRVAERRYLESGRAVVHVVRDAAELSRGIEVLADLHQRRRQTLGEPGCFASPRFAAFHRDVMPRLLADGRLHLFWVELDGRPAVAEYFLLGDDATYSYQAGLNPDCMADSPGRLGNLLGLQHAIALGHRAYDFLRGDEPYKAHFRASPRAMLETRIVASRPGARRGGMAWLLGSGVKRRAKRLVSVVFRFGRGSGGEETAVSPSVAPHPDPLPKGEGTQPSPGRLKDESISIDADQTELVVAGEDR